MRIIYIILIHQLDCCSNARANNEDIKHLTKNHTNGDEDIKRLAKNHTNGDEDIKHLTIEPHNYKKNSI